MNTLTVWTNEQETVRQPSGPILAAVNLYNQFPASGVPFWASAGFLSDTGSHCPFHDPVPFILCLQFLPPVLKMPFSTDMPSGYSSLQRQMSKIVPLPFQLLLLPLRTLGPQRPLGPETTPRCLF